MPSERDIALVVDDTPETLSVLTDALEEAGLMVLIARDGDKALDLAGRVTPDIILMDAVMPGTDGFETCRRLKQKKDLANVPVIFLTGLTETEDILKGLQAGGVDYVTKPIVPDELIARIGVHLANARLAQSLRVAADLAGRSLIAVDRDMTVLWCTPKAAALCERAGYGGGDGELDLPAAARAGLAGLMKRPAGRGTPAQWRPSNGVEGNGEAGSGPGIIFTYVGQTGGDEFLFRVIDGAGPTDLAVLEGALALTHREAEVLLWIAQGKSNRDIGDILQLSPRTVNKHLEQIFDKLGVENRTAAAALAVRTMVAAEAG
jgi:DNA-binding NarL/FixJ family response regulator